MANGTTSTAKAVVKPKGEGLGARLMKFLRESWNETFKKSSWPSRAELRQFTIVVIFAVGVVTVWIGGIDMALRLITMQLLGQ